MGDFEESIPIYRGRAILITMWNRRCGIVLPLCAVISLLAGWPGGVPEVRAATVYTYIDEHGNPVFTDRPETIPEKYRAKVKTHERPDTDKQSSSGVASVKEKVTEQLKAFGARIPPFRFNLSNAGSTQGDILNYAGLTAVVLLLIMYFSKKSPMIRLLALGLLIVLAIGTPVLIYTSDGGALNVMKQKAITSGQAQHDRIQQIPQ